MAQQDSPFVDREAVRQVPTNVVLPVIFREKLRYLARVTRVPQAEFVREAIRDLLAKYHHVLDGTPAAADEHDG